MGEEESNGHSGNLADTTSYEAAAEYWDGVAPTVDGMLGGFGKISK